MLSTPVCAPQSAWRGIYVAILVTMVNVCPVNVGMNTDVHVSRMWEETEAPDPLRPELSFGQRARVSRAADPDLTRRTSR